MIISLGPTPAVQRTMTFDHLAIDGVNRTGDVSQYASGKSVNAGRVLHTLGAAVLCTGFVGGDSGQFLLNDLDDAEISHHFVRVEPATRMCITLVDRAAGTATELIEESKPLPAVAYEQLISTLRELLPTAGGLMLCGSLPPGAPMDFYAECVSLAIAAGKTVLLDAAGEPLRRALASGPTIIKPNRSELALTVNSPVETDAELKSAIAQLLAMGPKWAVVTNGSKETVASDGVGFWKISTPKVKVISAIGSGDSFAAGLMAGLSSGQSIPDACRLAAACGAANAMTALAGHLKKADVDALVQQVTVGAF
jgi:1-phosphofructokinase family hexose kinase